MIGELRDIELHDAPLRSLKVDFAEAIIILTVAQYNDELKEYYKIELSFLDVSNFYIDKLPDLSTVEILEMNIDGKDGSHSIEFLLRYDYPYALIKLSFSFGELQIAYGNS